LTDAKNLEMCSVTPPEITKLFLKLSKYGLPSDVLDIDEALDLITRKMRRTKFESA
jgi:hypothetical protein